MIQVFYHHQVFLLLQPIKAFQNNYLKSFPLNMMYGSQDVFDFD
jgi:hypothetical protein